MRKIILNYTFATGTAEELRQGDPRVTKFFRDPSKIVKMLFGEHPSGLVIPKFMGVYQKERLSADPDDPEDVERLEAVQKDFVDARAENMKHADELFFSNYGALDTSHSELIFVAYNPQFWTNSSVRESLDDKIKMVSVGSVTQMPDFYEKDPTLIPQIYEMSQGEGESFRKKNPILERTVNELEKQLRLYGATRGEYMDLTAFKQARRKTERMFFPMDEGDMNKFRAK